MRTRRRRMARAQRAMALNMRLTRLLGNGTQHHGSARKREKQHHAIGCWLRELYNNI